MSCGPGAKSINSCMPFREEIWLKKGDEPHDELEIIVVWCHVSWFLVLLLFFVWGGGVVVIWILRCSSFDSRAFEC